MVFMLSEYAEFNYKCTNYYFPEYERTIIWNDDNLKIKWPIIENIDLNI